MTSMLTELRSKVLDAGIHLRHYVRQGSESALSDSQGVLERLRVHEQQYVCEVDRLTRAVSALMADCEALTKREEFDPCGVDTCQSRSSVPGVDSTEHWLSTILSQDCVVCPCESASACPQEGVDEWCAHEHGESDKKRLIDLFLLLAAQSEQLNATRKSVADLLASIGASAEAARHGTESEEHDLRGFDMSTAIAPLSFPPIDVRHIPVDTAPMPSCQPVIVGIDLIEFITEGVNLSKPDFGPPSEKPCPQIGAPPAKPEPLPPLEQEDEAAVKMRVETWQEGKNIRALLASLHDVAPPHAWNQVGLGELLQHEDVRRAYMRALRVVHPDKCQNQNLGKMVTDALVKGFREFKQV